jgi:hypothetical protein
VKEPNLPSNILSSRAIDALNILLCVALLEIRLAWFQ